MSAVFVSIACWEKACDEEERPESIANSLKVYINQKNICSLSKLILSKHLRYGRKGDCYVVDNELFCSKLFNCYNCFIFLILLQRDNFHSGSCWPSRYILLRNCNAGKLESTDEQMAGSWT